MNLIIYFMPRNYTINLKWFPNNLTLSNFQFFQLRQIKNKKERKKEKFTVWDKSALIFLLYCSTAFCSDCRCSKFDLME